MVSKLDIFSKGILGGRSYSSTPSTNVVIGDPGDETAAASSLLASSMATPTAERAKICGHNTHNVALTSTGGPVWAVSDGSSRYHRPELFDLIGREHRRVEISSVSVGSLHAEPVIRSSGNNDRQPQGHTKREPLLLKMGLIEVISKD
jgi:hypothetical protein